MNQTILMIPGNFRPITFMNCLAAATEKLREKSGDPERTFSKVHVIHTTQSQEQLINYLRKANIPEATGLRQRDLIHYVVDMSDEADVRIADMLPKITEVTGSGENSQFYFDLTTGITQVKVALGVIAFLLGTSHVYTLEIDFKNEEQKKWNLDELRANNVRINYREISGLNDFDSFGFSNLTTVERTRPELAKLQRNLEESLGRRASEVRHVISLLEQAERNSLEIRSEEASGVATRGLLFHAMAAAEALIDLIFDVKGEARPGETLGVKLNRLKETADAGSSHPIDPEIFERLTALLLRIRNHAAHDSSPLSNVDVSRILGDLGLRLAKSFIWLMAASLDTFIAENGQIAEVEIVRESLAEQHEWYVGLDGDQTGAHIAKALKTANGNNREIRARSETISKAINNLKHLVKQQCGAESILFATGDNMMFHGRVDGNFVERLRERYRKDTGLTISVGMGHTPHQASIALSLAKGQGGDAVEVINLRPDEDRCRKTSQTS